MRRGEVNCRGLTEAQEELLLGWVVHLKKKTLSVTEAARRLGCSRGVVTRARDGLRGKARRGRPPVLTAEEELAIERKILFYYSRGVPLTETDVCTAVQFYINEDVSPQRRKLARSIFKDGRPGRQWMVGFRRRHPAVAKVTGRPLSGVRAAATSPETMARMMALLKQVREEKGIKPCNIFNADECGINAQELLASRRKKYLAPTGTASASVLVPGVASDAESLTFLPVIAADGTHLPPTLVFKGTPGHVKRRRPKTGDNGAASWQFLTDVAPPGAHTIFKTPPGMDKDMWTQWCIRYAAEVFSTTRPCEPKMLIIDGCRVHIAWEALAKDNVEIFVLPANSAHATQQLDVVVFQPFKRSLRDELSIVTRDMDISNNKNVKLGLFEVVEAITRAAATTFNPTVIKRAWAETGVEPWNPDKLHKHTSHSDSVGRKRKSEQSLSHLTARLAPSVAAGRHNLQWERGTLRTTQAVFMDKDNRRWLAEKESAKTKAKAAKAAKKEARAAEVAARRQQEEQRRAGVAQRRSAAAAKKAADAAAKQAAAADRKAVAAARKAAASATRDAAHAARLAAQGRKGSGKSGAATADGGNAGP